MAEAKKVATKVAKKDDLQVIRKQTDGLLVEIDSLDLNTEAGEARVAEISQMIKKAEAGIEEEMDKIVKPLKVIIDDTKAKYKPFLDMCTLAKNKLKQKVNDFRVAKRQEEAKIAAKVDQGKMKPETAVRKLEEAGPTKNTIGGVTARKITKVRILDEAKLPKEYLITTVNLAKVKIDLQAGIQVPGAELYVEESLAI